MRIHLLVRAGLVVACCQGGMTAWAAPRAAIDARHLPLLATHCQQCHGPETQESGVRVDDLPAVIDTIAAAERWQKVLNVLNSGEMPPENEPQPERAAKADLLDDLATAMVTARKLLADQGGRIAMRRLNRREYQNTIRDLLGVEIDVGGLPADTSPLAFDTVGASLFMTASQFEQYETLGRDAITAAFKQHAARGARQHLRIEAEQTLVGFKKANAKLQADQQAARDWFAKLEAAVASPENAAFVAATRPTLKDEKEFRFHWRSLAGLPAPDDAVANSGNNPQYLTVILEEKRFIPYEERYLTMPGLDTGAYLAIPAGTRAPNSNARLNFDIPADWPPGEYVVRIRCGARPEAAAERRYLEFGQRSSGDRTPAISTHHVTGTMEAPEVIEIPYTLVGPAADPAARRLMIREIGTGSSAAVRRIFNEGVKADGIGPELAIWVDWIEVERRPEPADAMAPGIKALEPLFAAEDAGAVSDAELQSGSSPRRIAACRPPPGRWPGCWRSMRFAAASGPSPGRRSSKCSRPCSRRPGFSTGPNREPTTAGGNSLAWNWPPGWPTSSRARRPMPRCGSWGRAGRCSSRRCSNHRPTGCSTIPGRPASSSRSSPSGWRWIGSTSSSSISASTRGSATARRRPPGGRCMRRSPICCGTTRR